jgi:hypothetical protein
VLQNYVRLKQVQQRHAASATSVVVLLSQPEGLYIVAVFLAAVHVSLDAVHERASVPVLTYAADARALDQLRVAAGWLNFHRRQDAEVVFGQLVNLVYFFRRQVINFTLPSRKRRRVVQVDAVGGTPNDDELVKLLLGIYPMDETEWALMVETLGVLALRATLSPGMRRDVCEHLRSLSSVNVTQPAYLSATYYMTNLATFLRAQPLRAVTDGCRRHCEGGAAVDGIHH